MHCLDLANNKLGMLKSLSPFPNTFLYLAPNVFITSGHSYSGFLIKRNGEVNEKGNNFSDTFINILP